jgi:hypothetical protein
MNGKDRREVYDKGGTLVSGETYCSGVKEGK